MFTCVAAVGDAETEVEVKVLEETSLEVMSLDHTETVDGPVADRELHSEGQKQERHLQVSRHKKSQTTGRALIRAGFGPFTHVAPTVHSFRKAGVN